MGSKNPKKPLPKSILGGGRDMPKKRSGGYTKYGDVLYPNAWK